MNQQQYPNPYRLPPIDALSSMSSRDIGLMLLPILAKNSRAQVPNELVRGIVDRYCPRDMGAEDLLMEGIGFLERAGYVCEAMTLSGPWRMIQITREGRAAADSSGTHSARALSAATLLHPTIESEALPEIDRGPDQYSTAIFKAFKAVEVAVRTAGNFADDKVGVQLMSAAFGPTGPLRDPSSEAGEADALRNLFSGAVGAFKNPMSHRAIDERDARHAMGLLAFASVLLEIVDRQVASKVAHGGK